MANTKENENLREDFPDVLRAVALFGILMVNMQYFHSSSFNMILGIDSTLGMGEYISQVFVKVFAQGKFWTIFSLIFGASLYFATGKVDRNVQIKRIFMVFIIGLLHYIFIWDGDILLSYAVAGVIILACLHKNIILMGLITLGMGVIAFFYSLDVFILIVAMWVLYFGVVNKELKSWLWWGLILWGCYFLINTWLFSTLGSDFYFYLTNMRMEEEIAMSTYQTYIQYRLDNFIYDTVNFSIMHILAIMAIGVGMVDFIFNKKEKENKKIIYIAGVLCLIISFLSTIYLPRMTEDNYLAYLFVFSTDLLWILPISIFYIYLAQKAMSKYVWIKKFLTSAGRMSLSIYISQSLFWVGIFYIFPGAAMAHHGLLLVCGVLFVGIQIYLANLWLGRFKYGPLEAIVKKIGG